MKQELAYQRGLNDGMRQQGAMTSQRGFFGRGMDFASGFCGSFMGSCAANMANCFRGFGGGFGRGFGW
ncbi:hypothetical protein ACFJIX_13850 [Roseateles sp. UC29_93]|uniref:hypothetical protein n=1 Tax=Roseateles sp. UC29_93 TaxID=3350177 RepID=UPI00366B0B91